MIPYSYVTGTFSTAAGTVRANERITFQPLSTPYAVDGEVVLSVPQIVLLNNQGQIHDGSGNLRFKLAKGFYRVTASDTDAFTIEVPDDQAEHNIASLTTQVAPSPVIGVQQLLTPNDVLNTLEDSGFVSWSNRGSANGPSYRFLFLGELGDVSDEDYFSRWLIESQVFPHYVLGNANPGGLFSTVAASLIQWNTQIINATGFFQYALGSVEYSQPAQIDDILGWLGNSAPGRYYKSSAGGVNCVVDVFVLDSNDDTPDGNTASSVQGQWLKDELAASTARWKIVCFHAPPVCAVAGKANAAMNWPFKTWGADLVVTGGPKVAEIRATEDGCPLIIVGTGGKGPYDSFTEPFGTGTSTDRLALMVDASAARLDAILITVGTGARWAQVVVEGKADRRVSASVDVEWDSGLRVRSDTGAGLQLEPYGFAQFLGARNGRRADYICSQNYVPVVHFDSVPTASMARAEPVLKKALIMVGFDPITMWAWNKASSAFEAITAYTYDGVSQYNGSRTQLAVPTFASGNDRCLGVTVSHETPGVLIWVSLNAGPFTLMESWPAVVLFENPQAAVPCLIAAFASKDGYIDSEITYQAFKQSGEDLVVTVTP